MRALSLAIMHPDAEVLAITTVHGCVGADQATANVLRLQRAAGLEKKLIPIYKGASEAIIRKPFEVVKFFGVDGIGDCPDVSPKVLPTDFTVREGDSAAMTLLRLTKEHGDVTIVCLGPLTNIALAYKLDPKFSTRIKKLVILGGNHYGVGNVDEFSSAEFNFHDDPEAAKIVIEEMDTDTILVPWENVYFKGPEVSGILLFLLLHRLRNASNFVIFSDFLNIYEKLVDFEAHLKVGTPLATFLSHATRICREISRKCGNQLSYCDEIAVAIAIDERIAKKASLYDKELCQEEKMRLTKQAVQD
uniref:IU_nuc_hydro domain-containing protein n=1 Tax=Angiostrongylus cantonensis TaxID=6313 RepID=A0A0K0D0J9_ANGCA